jgi:hypothetical protein
LTASALSTLSACGGQIASTGSTATPQPVTSSVTISATGGSLQHTTSFSLTIN